MHTPGHDAALALGFLFAVGIIAAAHEVVLPEAEPSTDLAGRECRRVTPAR
jgi:formate dehydrogenase assembly factor FdhD